MTRHRNVFLMGFLLVLLVSANAMAIPSLRDEELGNINAAEKSGDSVANKQWFDRIDIGGSIAAGFMYSGSSRADFQNFHFGVHEANITLDAQVWDGIDAVISLFPIWWPATF